MQNQQFFVLMVIELQNFIDAQIYQIKAFRYSQEVANYLSIESSFIRLDLGKS
jgi:hypothetical protein